MKESYSKLLDACFNNDIPKVVERIYSGDNIDIQGTDLPTPLSVAAYFDYSDLVRELLFLGAQVNYKDKDWMTALHWACLSGSFNSICLLLKANADINVRDRTWQTPLLIASSVNHLNCFGLIMENTKKLNVTDRLGWTALHHASFHGNLEAIQLLVSRGLSLKLLDKRDRSCLHYASYDGHIEVVEYLIQNGIDPNGKDKNNLTPLHLAALAGHTDVCRILICSGSDVSSLSKAKNTPLHFACFSGESMVIELLLQKGADEKSLNKNGQHPIHISCLSTNLSNIARFLNDQTFNQKDKEGRQPIHYLSYQGNVSGFKTLMKYPVDINAIDNNGFTALHISCIRNNLSFIRELSSYKVNLNLPLHDGRTIIHLSSKHTSPTLCDYFVQEKCDFNAKDIKGRLALHYSALEGNIDNLRILFTKDNANILDEYKRNSLHYAVIHGVYDVVCFLVSSGVSINHPDSNGRTPLHYAAFYNSDGSIIQLLLDNGAKSFPDQNGLIPLHYAITSRHNQAINILLKYQEEIKISTPGLSLLHLAAYFNDNILLSSLLRFYPKDSIPCDENGYTPFHNCALVGNKIGLGYLFKHFNPKGLCVPLGDEEFTLLHIVASTCQSECVRLLIENMNDDVNINAKTKRGWTPLMIATAIAGVDSVVKYLLSKGANVEPRLPDGDIGLIHLAASNVVVNNLNYILDKGADPNDTCSNGFTPLILTCIVGCKQQAKLLLKKGARVDILDKNGFGPIHWAAYRDNSECLELILRKNPEIDIYAGNSFTPFHCAVLGRSTECVHILSKWCKDIRTTNDDYGRNPLQMAISLGEPNIVEILLDFGFDPNMTNSDGQTALHIACMNSCESYTELCLRHCKEYSPLDNYRNTPLMLACENGCLASCILLIDKISKEDLQLRNLDGKSAYDIASEEGLDDVVEKLSSVLIEK